SPLEEILQELCRELNDPDVICRSYFQTSDHESALLFSSAETRVAKSGSVMLCSGGGGGGGSVVVVAVVYLKMGS
ncbi:hypothetical protein Tco_0293402, partial [Tanacetum coccineum]